MSLLTVKLSHFMFPAKTENCNYWFNCLNVKGTLAPLHLFVLAKQLYCFQSFKWLKVFKLAVIFKRLQFVIWKNLF